MRSDFIPLTSGAETPKQRRTHFHELLTDHVIQTLVVVNQSIFRYHECYDRKFMKRGIMNVGGMKFEKREMLKKTKKNPILSIRDPFYQH